MRGLLPPTLIFDDDNSNVMLIIFLSSARCFQSQGVKYEIFPKLKIDRTKNGKSKFLKQSE